MDGSLMVEERYLEVKQYLGEGYRPCVDYGRWRVAILRHILELDISNIHFMERHLETDEVFVLLDGRCILLIGEGEEEIEKIHAVDMASQKIYNVKKGVFHTHTLSRDAVVLIVENKDTGLNNSERIPLLADQRREILSLTRSLWKDELDSIP